jgi:sulfide:quinone oxidoreductase
MAHIAILGAGFGGVPDVNWFRNSRYVHWVKIVFEKYFIYKMKRGNPEAVYERFMLRALGIKRPDT